MFIFKKPKPKSRQEKLKNCHEKNFYKIKKKIQILLCCKKPRVQKSAKIKLSVGWNSLLVVFPENAGTFLVKA